MATVIGAVSRLFQPTIGVLSAEKLCQGTNLWYFLIGLRMVTLFFAYGPWDSLKNDLTCLWPSDIGDAKNFCSALCYNQHFLIPISSTWAFHFIAIIFIVALMKFVHVPEKGSSAKDAEANLAPGTNRSCEPAGQTKSGTSWRYGVYIFCIMLVLAIELIFIWILLGLQLPVMNQRIISCRPNNPACPPSAQCALSGRSDKQAILWVLAFCAAANASVSIAHLATHGGQACGCCGGSVGRGTARAGDQGDRGGEPVGCGCRCDGAGCNDCQRGSGGWARAHGYRCDGGVGTAGCRCQMEGGISCCGHGSNTSREVACGCQDNRGCSCCFQGSEAGKSRNSRNSVSSREDSEGKLLRGDTELEGERKEWSPNDGKMQIREPLRTAPPKSRGGNPARGRAVKYVAKYQAWGKRRV